MFRLARCILLVTVLLLPARITQAARDDRRGVLSFEACGRAGNLKGWNGVPIGPSETLFLDSTVVHEGRYSGRVERNAGSPSTFSSFGLELPADFSGNTLELRGWARWENVKGTVGLWQRQDARAGRRQFDNMSQRGLSGTSDWTELRLPLLFDPHATSVHVGALLIGTGKLWIDDLRLFVDGRPLADAPFRELPKIVLDPDTTFLGGSRFATTRLNAAQLDDVVLLGRVWGFLKYHHPAIVSGTREWDFDLFRIIPAVVAAKNRAQTQRVMAAWVDSIGAISKCDPCAQDPAGRPLVPALGWLSDKQLLGEALSARLLHVYANRPVNTEQFFVGRNPGAGNPDFWGEAAYPPRGDTDPGYRLLAVFRFWNMVEYWFPYRELITEKWERLLRASVAEALAAASEQDYKRAMARLVVSVCDGHAGTWSWADALPPGGSALLPVAFRIVEGKPMVADFTHPTKGPASGLKIGDVLLAIDGVPIDTIFARMLPFHSGSNETYQRYSATLNVTRGAPGPTRLDVDRNGNRIAITAERMPADSLARGTRVTHDLPGPAFRRLSEDLAYLKLSSFIADSALSYVKQSAGAKCLIIDIRNYPASFAPFSLGQYLVRDATPFARFTKADLSNPGSFDWSEPVTIYPSKPRFEGRVAVLVDEISISQSEYTAMALRSVPDAIVVGSTTAGADGNVSPIPLPGGLNTRFSGIGVYYPDKKPTQRIGILPDLVVRPTLAGLRGGRDEVLEAAARKVLGRPLTNSEILAMTSSPASASTSP